MIRDHEHELQDNEGWFASSLMVFLAVVFLVGWFLVWAVGAGVAAVVRRIRQW